MSTHIIREAFERTNGRDHRRQPPKGNNYIDPMAQADWESFQKGWKQSREALVITLPARSMPFDYQDKPVYSMSGEGRNAALDEVRTNIESEGVIVACQSN